MRDIGDLFFKGTYMLVFISSLSPAQVNPARSKGEVFKHRPERPYENTDYSGEVVVKKSLYGLTFQDTSLSADVKNRIERFFKRRLNGYTELKTYQLQIYKKNGKWYVENTAI
jgi:hypothetical protein